MLLATYGHELTGPAIHPPRLKISIWTCAKGTPFIFGGARRAVCRGAPVMTPARATSDANPAVTLGAADFAGMNLSWDGHRYAGGKLHGPAGQLPLRIANDWHSFAKYKTIDRPKKWKKMINFLLTNPYAC